MATERVVTEVADHIQDVGEVVEEVAEVTRGLDMRVVGAVCVGLGVGVAVGFGIGYLSQKKRIAKKLNAEVEIEINKMREFYYQKQVASEKKPTLEEAVKEAGYTTKLEGPNETLFVKIEPEQETSEEESEEVEASGPVQQNVFDENVSETPWDYEVELRTRVKEHPYVIHAEEFKENIPEYDQVQYTYYEADDVLTDSKDVLIDDLDYVVGLENLTKFGHGSGQTHVVYIRNEKLSLDIEICRSPGSFTEEVHGYVRHSYDRKKKHKRGFDDDQ